MMCTLVAKSVTVSGQSCLKYLSFVLLRSAPRFPTVMQTMRVGVNFLRDSPQRVARESRGQQATRFREFAFEYVPTDGLVVCFWRGDRFVLNRWETRQVRQFAAERWRVRTTFWDDLSEPSRHLLRQVSTWLASG